jgi:hypothetical protein
VIAVPPTATWTVTTNSTSAVPSLMMLSPRNTVRDRRGNCFARPATAAASVGESTAPSTAAACDSMPSARAVHDTATAVAITRATLSRTMMRTFARISRKLVFMLSQ